MHPDTENATSRSASCSTSRDARRAASAWASRPAAARASATCSTGEPRQGDRPGVRGPTGARVFVDPKSLKFLDGTVLDYDTGLISKGFMLKNPKAKATCGCGVSLRGRAPARPGCVSVLSGRADGRLVKRTHEGDCVRPRGDHGAAAGAGARAGYTPAAPAVKAQPTPLSLARVRRQLIAAEVAAPTPAGGVLRIQEFVNVYGKSIVRHHEGLRRDREGRAVRRHDAQRVSPPRDAPGVAGTRASTSWGWRLARRSGQ